MVTYFFVLFATLAIASAIAMILNKNTVNSALFLVVNLVSLSGIYLLLQAQFLAVIQILVYAGAIMVLFLFVIMLLNLDNEENILNKFRIRYGVAFIVGIAILAQLLYSVGTWTNVLPTVSPKMVQTGTVEAVGDVLFSHYLLPFEVTAILLTAAVVGALLIAQRKIQTKK
jgi:NADH-quinone oxidoreductase subunit J